MFAAASARRAPCSVRRVPRVQVRAPPTSLSLDDSASRPADEENGGHMPTSMTASHGGVLYYVVKVPKDDPTLDYVSATASHKYLEEKRVLSPLNLE